MLSFRLYDQYLSGFPAPCKYVAVAYEKYAYTHKTPFKMRCPAAICSDLRGVNSSLCIGHFCTKNAKLSKILQDVYSNRSRNGVKG